MKEELNSLAVTLRRAFIDRPVPEGTPREELFETTQEFLDLLCSRLRTLVEASNALFEGSPSEREPAAEPPLLHCAMAELIDSYHALWRRPFPAGLEQGQILLAAVFERPMRDYLGTLEEALDTFSDKGSVVGKVELTVELCVDEELARLQQWLEQTALAQRRELIRPWRFGLGALVASFALGWLLGDGD